MTNLSLVESLALAKLAEQESKRCKDAGETIEPGTYPFAFDLKVDGNMSRGVDTTISATFQVEKFLKALMLKYAASLGDIEEGKEWLSSLLSVKKGAMAAIIKLGPQAIIDKIPAEILAVWDATTEDAKKHFHKVSEKVSRAGQTIVVGTLERT